MGSLDAVSLAILLGSLLVLTGILSSLIALRFGAPLLLVFLLVGMLAGEGGPGGIKFDDVGIAYTVGSDRTGVDPVRWRTSHALRQPAQRAGPGGDAGHRGRADHDVAHRSGRKIRARHRLDPGNADRGGREPRPTRRRSSF